MAKKKSTSLAGVDLGILNVSPEDSMARKLLMLVEGEFGIGVQASIAKYSYTEQRYYQLLKEFRAAGSGALADRKRGPKQKSVRQDQVVQQIIRYRFLDPEASVSVICQKLRQTGFSISMRSVERTIQEYGLQKKTLPAKPGQAGT